jgi:hypothetical protein
MKTKILSACALLLVVSARAETLMSHLVLHKAEQPAVPRASILDKPIALKLEILPLVTTEGAPVEVFIKQGGGYLKQAPISK